MGCSLCLSGVQGRPADVALLGEPLERHWSERQWRKQGFCLYYKVLQKGRFPWPKAGYGAVRPTSAQLAMLWEGIDRRRPDWGVPPARVG